MIFRQLTANNDWTFGAGIANYATAQQAIALNIQTSVLMWQGDCFFSLSGWINWRGLLNVGQQKNLNTALQTQISQAFGVMIVTSANVVINRSTRMATATYIVDTVYSTQIVNQVAILSGQTGN